MITTSFKSRPGGKYVWGLVFCLGLVSFVLFFCIIDAKADGQSWLHCRSLVARLSCCPLNVRCHPLDPGPPSSVPPASLGLGAVEGAGNRDEAFLVWGEESGVKTEGQVSSLHSTSPPPQGWILSGEGVWGEKGTFSKEAENWGLGNTFCLLALGNLALPPRGLKGEWI